METSSKAGQAYKISMHIQSPGRVRTVYSTICKDIQAYSGILMHVQPHSQARNQAENIFLIVERKAQIVFLTKYLSKCPSSTNPSSCLEKLLVAHLHSGIILFAKRLNIQEYSAPFVILAYSQPYHILSPGIFRIRGLFKTLWSIDEPYSEPFHRVLFSHIQAYSQSCAKLAYAKTWYTGNPEIFRALP